MIEKINIITSSCIPLPQENVDTDQIIPARFLKAVSREGFGENLFRVGSTWDRENLNSSPTAAAQNELLAIAKNMLPAESGFKIAAHSAGVRPCTATTRPHLGSHPEDPRLLSFNGFGSKGYALSPYFARHFADHLENASPIDPEADLKRHVKKFFKSRY